MLYVNRLSIRRRRDGAICKSPRAIYKAVAYCCCFSVVLRKFISQQRYCAPGLLSLSALRLPYLFLNHYHCLCCPLSALYYLFSCYLRLKLEFMPKIPSPVEKRQDNNGTLRAVPYITNRLVRPINQCTINIVQWNASDDDETRNGSQSQSQSSEYARVK